jgi:hypothetical protein
MRAYNLILLMLVFGVVIQQVAFLVPSYNNGQGLTAGNVTGLNGVIANWQLSQKGILGTSITQNSSGWDVLTYLLTAFINAILMLFQAFTLAFVVYPVFVAVFLIPAQISAILQVIIVVIELFGVYQVLKGTPIIVE